MDVKQKRRWKSLENSLALLHHQKTLEPQVKPLVRDLEAAIEQIWRLYGEQRSASLARRGYPTAIRRQRHELYALHMYRISRRGPELMKWGPKAEAALRLPHPSIGNPRLIAAAGAMAKVVALKPSLFTREAHFPQDFLSRLRAATRKLASVIAESAENSLQLRTATTELARALSRGRRIVRTLDGVLKPRTHDDPAFGPLWRDASRIPKRTGRPKMKARKKNTRTEPPESEL
jgi:hypothetical protein